MKENPTLHTNLTFGLRFNMYFDRELKINLFSDQKQEITCLQKEL